MNRYKLAQLLILAAAVNFFGCGGAAEKAGGDGKAAAAPPTANVASPAPAAPANAAPADSASAPASSAVVATAPQGASPPSETRGASNAQPAKMPTPRIGSGGNDLFLFTQVRAAVNADPELRAANLIVEVKDGVVTLSGTVAGAAAKAKAEELARGAGSKSVRNQLKISTGK
jgi:hypothetical protein